MQDLIEKGELDEISIELQEDAALFFSRRNMMTDSDSKKTLQMINKVLKTQPGSNAGQPLDWADLRTMIAQAVKDNDPREKFEELLANVVVFMEDLVRNGQLDAYSTELQNAAVAY